MNRSDPNFTKLFKLQMLISQFRRKGATFGAKIKFQGILMVLKWLKYLMKIPKIWAHPNSLNPTKKQDKENVLLWLCEDNWICQIWNLFLYHFFKLWAYDVFCKEINISHSKTEKGPKCTKNIQKNPQIFHHFRKRYTHVCNYFIHERPGMITYVFLQ